MILDIFRDAIEYPSQDYKALLKLGVCMLLSFLIIPIFLVLGYEYRVIEISSKGMIGGKEDLPEFTDLISMFVDGLKIFLVNIVYMLIPIAVFLAFGLTGNGISGINAWFANGVVTTGFIVTIIVAIIFYFISLMATVNMVANGGNIKSAFNIPELWQIINNIGWGRYILLYIGYLIIYGVVIVLTFIAQIIVTMLFGIVGAFAGIFTTTTFIAGIIVSLVFTLLVQPYVAILKNRALGLIYEPIYEE